MTDNRINKKNNKTGDSKSNIFLLARIKLTIFYTAFIAVLVFIFSIAIYFSYSYYLQGSFQEELTEIENENQTTLDSGDDGEHIANNTITPEQIRKNASSRLSNIILIADGAIIIIAAFLGYTLAGVTLRPIQKNHEIQKRFMSDTSHELRTPLSIMKTGLEVQMRNPTCPPECKPVLSSNLEEVNRMSGLVRDLLLISRMDSGSEVFTSEEIDLEKLLDSALHSIQDYAMEKKIEIKSNGRNTILPEGNDKKTNGSVFIIGDPDKLKQAFFNILKNAVDYSDEGGKIDITTTRQPRFIQVEIMDNGPGIPEDELQYIFERFYRAKNAASLSKEGSGLGLAITKEIILNHRGSIKIESLYGSWTKAIVILPVSNR